MSKVPKFQFKEHPPAKVAKPAKPLPTDTLTFATFAPFANGKTQNQHWHFTAKELQTAPEFSPAACAACSWFELNPWTSYPGYAAWCHHRMEHLQADSLSCEEFHHGEVRPRQVHHHAPGAEAPPERILTCADCSHFEANHGPNPKQGWGFCQQRKRGRFGCATACESGVLR